MLGREGVGRRRGFELLELQLVLVEQALGALGALAVEGPAEAGDLQPEVGDQRGVARHSGSQGGRIGLGALGRGLGLVGEMDGPIGPGLGGREGCAQRLHVDDLGLRPFCHEQSPS